MNFTTKKCTTCGGLVLSPSIDKQDVGYDRCLKCRTDDGNRIYRSCCDLVITTQKASTSYVQRQLRIGYNLAAKLIDRMERENLISAPNSAGRRSVLVQEVPEVRS